MKTPFKVSTNNEVEMSILAQGTDPDEKLWRSMYVVAAHWQSDFKFFEDELRFLNGLINRYMIWLNQEKNIESTGKLNTNLIMLEKSRASFEKRIKTHLHHLSGLAINPYSGNMQVLKEEHSELEMEVATFVKKFRLFKKEVILSTIRVLGSEKERKLQKVFFLRSS